MNWTAVLRVLLDKSLEHLRLAEEAITKKNEHTAVVNAVCGNMFAGLAEALKEGMKK